MKTVCLDFDGVFNKYDGWRGKLEEFEPREGIEEFLKALQTEFKEIYIYSVRPAFDIYEWLVKHDLEEYVTDIKNTKPPAHVYLDDRAVCFNGDYNKAFKDVVLFKTYWEEV